MERYEDGIKMVNALTSFLRTGLNKGKDIISLEQEIKNVESYLQIQKLRYRNTFSYEIDIPKGMHRLKIPKLVLQPLVENAIYHGVKNQEDKGYIHIYGYTDKQDRVIVVADTGIGMDTQTLDDILSNKGTTGTSYGLSNVIERLSIYYKNKAKLTIRSNLGEGTEVTIRIKP